jgi:hypothetical protein
MLKFGSVVLLETTDGSIKLGLEMDDSSIFERGVGEVPTLLQKLGSADGYKAQAFEDSCAS